MQKINMPNAVNFPVDCLNNMGLYIKTSKSPSCSFHRICVYVDVTCDNDET